MSERDDAETKMFAELDRLRAELKQANADEKEQLASLAQARQEREKLRAELEQVRNDYAQAMKNSAEFLTIMAAEHEKERDELKAYVEQLSGHVDDVAALEKERDELCAIAACSEWRSRNEILPARARALLECAERIFKVTTHARDCHATIPGQKCTCGLNGLIAAYEKATGKKGT